MPDPNAYILRLGTHGPAGLNQPEALSRLFSSAAKGGELWFAVNIANPGQLQTVSWRLLRESWRFCASWEGVVRFAARASNVVTASDPQPVPSASAGATWTKDGRSAQARCWVQFDPKSFEEVRWTAADFLTWQAEGWRQGFPKNQTALLRAIVPD